MMDEYELFGWAVIDKYGVSTHVSHRKQHYFNKRHAPGKVKDDCIIHDPTGLVDVYDKEWPDLAPHTIEELYIKKRELLFHF
jgi:hypothetical protein